MVHAGELEALPKTCDWAVRTPIDSIFEFAKRSAGLPLYVVGSGGSLSVVAFASTLHQQAGAISRHLTPLEFLELDGIDGSYAVLIVTAGGNNGARIDVLRRFARLTHEQTHTTYSIAEEKASDLLCKLRSDLRQMTGKAADDDKYRFVFLIDDFTASGISYLRFGDEGSKGKIAGFDHERRRGPLKQICDDNVKVCVVLYVATKKAKEHIMETARAASIGIDKIITVTELDDSVNMTEEDLGDCASCKREAGQGHTDETLEGKHDKPHMGFDECGMALVLNHNCPNNSLPIIWHEPDDKENIRALFPRFQRHLDVV